MSRAGFIAVGIVAISVSAAGLTEATLARSDRASLTDGRVVAVTPRPTSRPTPTPRVLPTVTPTPVPTITPVLASGAHTATTNGFVHVRAAASINSAIIDNVNGGTVVTLGDYVDSQWQEVKVDGLDGYIYRSYLNY